jgi:glycerophosphoryl diester phosphodiesterase
MNLKVILLFLLAQSTLAQTLMVTHKGAWKDHLYPQNSIQALSRAVDNGFKGIEFDLYMSKDDQFILAHSNKLKRISTCDGTISRMKASQLKKCIVNKNTLLPLTQVLLKRIQKPKPLSTLTQVRDQLFSDQRVEIIWIDLKTTGPRTVKSLSEFMESIKDKRIKEKIVINSTSSALLQQLRKEIPDIRYSLEGNWGTEPLTDDSTYIDGIGKTHDMVSLNVGLYLGHEPLWKLPRRSKRFWNLLDQYIQKTKELGIKTIGWTVNKDKKIERLIDMDIDYLLTDKLYPR